MKKVCLLTDHHISINPRVWKEAFFYESRGWDVVILCKWHSGDLLSRDKKILEGHAVSYKPYLNLIKEETTIIKRFYYRARKRMAAAIQQYFKRGSGWAISHGPGLMFKEALKENADLYAAHLECAFFAGRKLIRAGKNVSFDFEDWYSRDYLVPSRPVKLLQSLEHFALNNGLFCTAASQAMVNGIREAYKTKKEITVIYNGFPVNDEVKKSDTNGNARLTNGQGYTKLIWFSRTIGPERGIEYLIDALGYLDEPLELHLLGDMAAGYDKFLQKKFHALRHRLFIHPFLEQEQLNNFLAGFDIGLAIEENINDNKKLTVSNKLLQYLQSGIKVVASDTAGHREVAVYFPKSVLVVDLYKPDTIAAAITQLEKNNEPISCDEKKRFEEIFSWEAQEKKLEDILSKVFSHGSTGSP